MQVHHCRGTVYIYSQHRFWCLIAFLWTCCSTKMIQSHKSELAVERLYEGMSLELLCCPLVLGYNALKTWKHPNFGKQMTCRFLSNSIEINYPTMLCMSGETSWTSFGPAEVEVRTFIQDLQEVEGQAVKDRLIIQITIQRSLAISSWKIQTPGADKPQKPPSHTSIWQTGKRAQIIYTGAGRT